jgi:hypothetical protein
MRMYLAAAFSLVASAGLPASADSLAFAAPAGWTMNSAATPPDPERGPMQWRLSSDPVSSLTFLRLPTAYPDAIAAIHTNFSTNQIKPAVDKDVPCRGTTAHVVEFAIGPDAHKIVVNRMVVPAADGIATVTYSRADGTPFSRDVQTAETAFCAATP